MIEVTVFWIATLCEDVVGYQSFRGPCCNHLIIVKTSSYTFRHWHDACRKAVNWSD